MRLLFDCTLFGKSAESLNQYLERGRSPSSEGARAGGSRTVRATHKVEVVVNSLRCSPVGGPPVVADSVIMAINKPTWSGSIQEKGGGQEPEAFGVASPES